MNNVCNVCILILILKANNVLLICMHVIVSRFFGNEAIRNL